MLLRKLQSSHSAVPVGMLLAGIGLLLNVTSQGLIQHLQGTAHLSPNTVDFLRGFCIGLGILLEIAGIIAMLPAIRAKRGGGGTTMPPQS